MQNKIKFALRYFNYLIKSKYYYGHGIHSPFVYQFVRSVIFTETKNKALKVINKTVKKYKNNKNIVFIEDFGAGSKTLKGKSRKISEIVRNSSTRKKYGKLIFRMVDYFQIKNAIEIGTSLGIGSLYIGISGKVQLHTIEGDKSLYKIAKTTFEQLNLSNIIAYNGEFDKVLPTVLEKINKLDFVYFDGNHKSKATLNYFYQCLDKIHNETVFVFDDIYWSKDMKFAWEQIKSHPSVQVSIDLFQIGIIFFKKELSKEHYLIRY
ncbi:MAG: class I SAM-dependent methyltransferase [Bacteroidales bacterium]|nr:class I SAM-dependent methyltransferase [Bacteroidales bacterium]